MALTSPCRQASAIRVSSSGSPALRESLLTSGVVFRSNSDTEVLLRLYQRHGPSFVERLRGMFAFAIWDDHERTCFLARDRFGIKPLYYHESGGVLAQEAEQTEPGDEHDGTLGSLEDGDGREGLVSERRHCRPR